MIEFETIIIILVIGVLSLITTVYLLITSKKVDLKNKKEQDFGKIKILNTNLKLVSFLYLLIILILFTIGIFSDFVVNSIIGFIFASIPITAYFIFDYKKEENARKK